MQKTALLLAKTDVGISVENLKRYAEYWHMDCDIRQLSWRTIKNRKFTINQLLWFLESKGYDHCGLLELKQYFSYVSTGHEDPNGRWGNAHLTKRVRPRTVQTYYIIFRYLEAEGVIEAPPVENIKPPVRRS